MSFCITLPVKDECCIGPVCFECGLTMPSDPKFANDVRWGDYFVMFTLTMVTIWNVFAFLKSYKKLNNQYTPILRLTNIIYAFGTGIFGLFRVHYQLGKPLLIMAAIHNLCEWVFVMYAFYKTKKEREYAIFGGIFWIFIVIGLMVMIFTEFPGYALVEQTTGIALDFMLPVVWLVLFIANNNNENSPVARAYFIAFIAHSIHLLFTILPLVAVNFVRDRFELINRILELVIFLSVPLTHILYTKFVTLHEQYIDLPSYKKSESTNSNNSNSNDGINNEVEYMDNYIVQIPYQSKTSALWRFIRMLSFYVFFVIIGLFPTVIIPALLPRCDSTIAPEIIAADDNFVIGTTTAVLYPGMSESFEYYVESNNLVENARNFEGNIFFYFNKDMFNPNTYFFVEAWESTEAAQKWIKSDYDRAVFNNYTYNMLIDGKLKVNGYLPINRKSVSDNVGKGAMKHVFKGFNGCDDVGQAIITLDNCDYILGCDHVEVINEEKREQIMVFDNDFRLHCFVKEPKKEINGDEVKYTMIHECDNGITEHYQFISDESKYAHDECHALVTFDVDLSIKTVDGVYEMYSTKSTQYIQQKFAVKLNVNENDQCRAITNSNNTSSCNL